MLLKFKKDFSFEHLYSGKLHFGDELSDKQTFWLVGTSCQGVQFVWERLVLVQVFLIPLLDVD